MVKKKTKIMWTLILRAEINEDYTVTKHIHLLEKDIDGNIITPHKKDNFESFVDVVNILLNQKIDVSNLNKIKYEEKLTKDELKDFKVIELLEKMSNDEINI